MRVLSSLAIGLLFCQSFVCAAYASADKVKPEKKTVKELIIRVKKMRRIFHVYVPPELKDKKEIPLVFVFHGAMENGEVIRRLTGMDELAKKNGFIAVYPYGSGMFVRKYLWWNAIDCCGFASNNKVNDVEFVSAMIDKLSELYSIDKKRIFACGYSNGAMFCFRLACELSDKIAAVTCVGGAMSGKEREPKVPVSVQIIHGTDDRHVPYNGGTGKWARWGYPVNREPVSYAVKFWKKADECTDSSELNETESLKTEVFSGKNKSEVKVITMKGVRHTWPSGKNSILYTDKAFNGLDASQECWNFFSTHPKASIDSKESTEKQPK